MNPSKLLNDQVSRFLNTHTSGKPIIQANSTSDLQLNTYDNRGLDTPRTSVVINIDESLITSAFIVEKEDEDHVKKWKISNCKSVDDAFNYLMSPNIRDQLSDTETVFLIKFKINENFGELSSGEIHELTKKCANKSIVVCLESSNDDNFLVYWKSKEIQKILTLTAYKDGFVEDDKELCEFVVEFLVTSLKSGHLGLHPNFSLLHEGTKIQLHLLADSRNYNLLLLASEVGNTSIVENLIKKGLNSELSNSKISAQSLAYTGGHYEVLKALVKANMLYPQDMDIENCSDDFIRFYEPFKVLHEMILARKASKVEEIIHNNPGFRYFYNFMNESALKTALINNCFDIYELLLSLQIYFGPHEDAESIMESFTEDERRQLREINFKYFKGSPEKHINILMANSILAHDTTDEHSKLKHLQRAFRSLNENPSLRIILMAVAASKKFRIIFDFNRDSVQLIDPTADSYTNGIFYLSGRIYIGAKQLLDPATENETFATMAHELCHYAMNLTYGNAAKPYKSKDKKAAIEFDKISQICQQNREKEEVIDLVYEHYPDFMQHAELIVRPPHLMALHHKNPEKLQESRENFSELFQNFENKVVAEMRRALSDIEAGADKIIEEKERIITKYKRRFYFSILITFIVGLVGYLSYTPTFVYDKLSVSNQARVRDGLVKYKGVDVKFGDLFGGGSVVYDKLSSEDIRSIFNGQTLDFSQPKYLGYQHYLQHDWGNLTSKLKDKILNSNFTFQNEDLKFQELSNDILNTLTSPQIIQILNGTSLTVSNMIQNRTKFYLERKFIPENTIEIFLEYHHRSINFNEGGNSSVLPPPPPGGIPVRHPFNIPKLNLTFEEFYKKYKKESFEKPPEFFTEEVNGFNIFNSLTPWFKGTIESQAESYEFLHKNFDQLIQEVEVKKILILSSEAGAGKTFTFQQLAMTIKKKFPSRWVSYISLKDYIPYYNQMEKLQDPEKFLEEIFKLSTKNEFERKIFEDSFRDGQVVLLWDGYDEIAPTYDEFVLKIINYIKDFTLNSQYVCTRPLFSKKLGTNFNVVPYKLVSFTEAKKREFLTKYFKSVDVNAQNIDEKIENVNKIVGSLEHSAPNDLNPRTFNTPLMLVLIAEVQDSQNITDTPNFYLIYSQFMTKKLQIWQNKGNFSNDVQTNTFVEVKTVPLQEIFQKYAILSDAPVWAFIYFPIFNKAKVIRNEIPKSLSFEEITRIGILFINGKFKFEFVHKTFTEFYIANYLIKNVYFADDDISEFEAEASLELFFLTFKTYGRFQDVITDFMRSFLDTEDAKSQERFSTAIANVLRTKHKHMLINYFTEGHPKLFEFFAEFFKNDHDLLVDLLGINDDKTLYTELFNPMNEVYFINPSEVAKIFKNYLSPDEFERFIVGKNQKGVIMTGMYYYAASKIPKAHENFKISNETLTAVLEVQHNLKVPVNDPKTDHNLDKMKSNLFGGLNLKNLNSSDSNMQPNLKLDNLNDTSNSTNLKIDETTLNDDHNLKIANLTDLKDTQNLKIDEITSNNDHNLNKRDLTSQIGANLEHNLTADDITSNAQHNLKTQITFWSFYDSELKPNLNPAELYEFFTSPAAAVLYIDYSPQNTSKLWAEASNILTKSEIGTLIGNIFSYLFDIVAEFTDFDEAPTLNDIVRDTEAQLSSPEIFQMALTSSLFHKAVFSAKSFKILWNFITNHTTADQRKQILMKNDTGSFYFTFRDSFHRDRFLHGGYYHDYFHFYDRRPYKVFQRSLLVNDQTLRGLNVESFQFALEIYKQHFSNSELMEMILESNFFLLRLMDHSPPEINALLGQFLFELFTGDEMTLKDFIVRKIGATNLTVLDIFKGFDALGDGLSEISRNRKVFFELYNKIKFKTGLN